MDERREITRIGAEMDELYKRARQLATDLWKLPRHHSGYGGNWEASKLMDDAAETWRDAYNEVLLRKHELDR